MTTKEQAERVVMALQETGYGYLVARWFPSERALIRLPRDVVRTEDEARALHRAIRLAMGKATPGNFEKWLDKHEEKFGWRFPWRGQAA